MEEPEISRLDHYGLVSGTIDELGIVELIDNHVGQFPDEKVSVGEIVKGLILNGLGFTSQPISLTPRFFEQIPIDLLIKEGVEPEDFNRFKIGRCLERIYNKGCSILFAKIARQSAERAGISTDTVHLDSTTFSVTGEKYEGEDEEAIRVTHGYSKDHRPDLKQVVQELLVSGDGGIPICSKSWNGNESDTKIFQERAKALKTQLLKGEWSGILVADSKLYTKDNCEALKDVPYITRIPHSLKEVKEIIETTEDTSLEIKSIPVEHYGIMQRWIICRSPESRDRGIKTVGKQVLKEEEAIKKELFHLQAKRFGCRIDAEETARLMGKKWRYHGITEITLETHKRYLKKGRPTSADAPGYDEYQISIQFCQKPECIDKAINNSATYIIGTNVPVEQLSDAQVVNKYKEQQKVERGFRLFKDPLFFVSSLFLKKPERIESLLMIMSLALLVYSIAERGMRKRLQELEQTIPNQIKNPTATPTLRWVFQLFWGINVLKIPNLHNSLSYQLKAIRINELQKKILALFPPLVQKIYSINNFLRSG